MKISLIIPCFNEEKNIEPFIKKCLKEINNNLNIEYIFINDGSSDNSYSEIKRIINEYKKEKIIGLNFSRNFGKEVAMLAGLKESSGDFVAIIDADLQQNPKYLNDMADYLKNHEDCDCVACYQSKRIENKFVSFLKKSFYKVINKVSDVPFKENASDFRMFNRKMANAIMDMQEYFRFSKGLFSFVGFNTYYMPYVVEERTYGKSSWSLIGLFKYAFNGIISFSIAPLKLTSFIGIISFIASLIYFIVILIKKFFVGISISGYATIVCLLLFFGGLQMIFLGIIGEYLGRIYIEIKRRPIYILKDKITRNEKK